MKKKICMILMMFCLLLTMSCMVTAKGDGREINITGYDEYTLGASIFDLDVSGFEGGPVENLVYKDFGTSDYIQAGREFNHPNGNVSTTILLSFIDDKLEMITLHFDEISWDFGGLDDVSCFVEELRSSFLNKYNNDLVRIDLFYFDRYSSRSGRLILMDENDRMIFLSWSEYNLDVVYTASSKSFRRIVEALGKMEKERGGKWIF